MEDLVRESAVDSRSRKARRGSFGLATAGLVAILTLSGSVAIMAQPAPQAVEAKAPAHLPAARQVLARFVKEIGGSTAFEKIQSQHMTGKFQLVAQGITGGLEVLAARPDKLLMKMNLPGIGEMSQGFDGSIGWSINPVTGPMVLDGKMLEPLREQARFDAVLHAEDEFKSMETIGQETFDGKDCYKLKLVRKSGQEVTEYYEVKTGLLAGSASLEETPLGSISVTAMVGDYKKFGDVLFATRLTQKMGPLSQLMTFEKMEFNQVDNSVFALPDQIKALVKKDAKSGPSPRP